MFDMFRKDNKGNMIPLTNEQKKSMVDVGYAWIEGEDGMAKVSGDDCFMDANDIESIKGLIDEIKNMQDEINN